MPTAAQIAAVYDFKNIFERALAAVFTANEVKAFTTQSVPSTGNAEQDAALVAAGWQIINFQKDRPRVEVVFTAGSGLGRWYPLPIDGTKYKVESAWAGTYRLGVITAADIRIHNAFVCQIRFLVHTMLPRINNVTPMTRHCIAEQFRDGGASQVTAPQDGIYQTDLQFDINFSVQANAWADLAT